jgi:hypothetical protein
MYLCILPNLGMQQCNLHTHTHKHARTQARATRARTDTHAIGLSRVCLNAVCACR